jgi:hypothetical protein
MRQYWIGRSHRARQRIDDLALDAIGEMPGIRDIRKAAPAVGNLLVLGERIGDRAKPHWPKVCQRLGGGLALPRLIVTSNGRSALCHNLPPTKQRHHGLSNSQLK